MIGACNVKHFLAPSPGDLGRGQKVKFHLISITKSIPKIFIPNFMCVLTNERYRTYQTGFYSVWGAVGARGSFSFTNMVMWYIKSTGMTSRTECK